MMAMGRALRQEDSWLESLETAAASKDWFLKHGLFNSMKPAPHAPITLEAQFRLVMGLVIGTAGYWGKVVQLRVERGRDDTPWSCSGLGVGRMGRSTR